MIYKKIVFIILILLSMNSLNYTKANIEKTFFDFTVNMINGDKFELDKFSGNVILMVNTASYCGFTKQYDDLQKLWETYKDKKLVVLGVPSNSFNQEKDNNNDIKNFCETNFNINFPMIELTSVKGDDAHEIYKWAKTQFGGSAVPKWNFHKILIDKNGIVVDTFAPFTNPMSKKILKEIERLTK
tara:strand:+ start:15 stop:569 length:555 start_codon:yes stop_codon:yes gene_type:complete